MLLNCEIILGAISEIFIMQRNVRIFIIWVNWIRNVGSITTDDFL